VYYRLNIVKEKQEIREPEFTINLGMCRLSGLTSYELKAVPEVIGFTSDTLTLLLSLDILYGVRFLWQLLFKYCFFLFVFHTV
jgi:hypothetical protein